MNNERSADIYYVPKMMSEIAKVQIASLALANTVVNTPEVMDRIILGSSSSTLVGAAAGAVAAYVSSKQGQ